jgi:hypothetical protein
LTGLISRGRARGDRDALWLVWGISALVSLAFLAQKLHHEYYWLSLAPVAAVGIGRSLALLAARHRAWAVAVTAAFFLLSGFQFRSTWRTPGEWQGIEEAAATVATAVPRTAWIVAPEALLFQADRRGCRLEWTNAAAARAAGEWGAEDQVTGPLELIEYYRSQGARYFADLGSLAAGQERKGLHDVLRRRYKVIVDRPEVIIADLADSEMHWNAN